MRDQKYYTKRIMKRVFSDAEFKLIHREYVAQKRLHGIAPGQRNTGSYLVYTGWILKRVITDWESFKEKYENAKTPTVNNLEKRKVVTEAYDWTSEKPQLIPKSQGVVYETICRHCGTTKRSSQPTVFEVDQERVAENKKENDLRERERSEYEKAKAEYEVKLKIWEAKTSLAKDIYWELCDLYARNPIKSILTGEAGCFSWIEKHVPTLHKWRYGHIERPQDYRWNFYQKFYSPKPEKYSTCDSCGKRSYLYE